MNRTIAAVSSALNVYRVGFYPRDAMLARVLAVVVCPCVTRRYYIETDAPIELVFA